MLLADVIFPAFTAPYFSELFFPIAALCAIASEVAVYRFHNRKMPLFRISWRVVYANLVSWLVGVLIGGVLPSGLVSDPRHHILTTGPMWTLMALCGFLVACLLSIGIEYAALRPFQKRGFPLDALGKCAVQSNVVSYLVLLVLVIIHLQFV
jgi:hypothetical protein